MGIETKIEQPKHLISRRLFLKNVAEYAAAAGIGFYLGGEIEMSTDYLENLAQKKKKARAIESPNPVADYSREILKKANVLLDNNFDEDSSLELLKRSVGIGLVCGLLATVKMAAAPRLITPRKLIGPPLAALVNRLVDNYSTYRGIKVMQDQRFLDYGFNEHIIEANPSLSAHPSPNELFSRNSTVQEIKLVALGIFPPIGFGLGATTPGIYLNNSSVAKSLTLAYKIGDGVKERLSGGYTREQVLSYISNLSLKELTG